MYHDGSDSDHYLLTGGVCVFFLGIYMTFPGISLYKGKNGLLFLIPFMLSDGNNAWNMMVPGEAVIISNYLTVSSMGILDTYIVLILPSLTSAMGIDKFKDLFRQFYMTFQGEYDDDFSV